MMTKYLFGDMSARNILVQMVDDHDLCVIENEVTSIRELTGDDFLLFAMKVNSWNHDLSPWNAPAVFGDESFGNGAEDTLKAVLNELGEIDLNKRYFIGGYSLAGLFALWSVYQTEIFSGAAAASPFLQGKERKAALERSCTALKKGGIFISFENIAPFTETGEKVCLEKWVRFQEEQGKSPEESRKHIERYGKDYYPMTVEEHLNLMRESGFRVVELLWFSNMQAGFWGMK